MDTAHYQGMAKVPVVTGFVLLYFLRLNRVDAAEKIAEEAHRHNPDYPLLHLLLANVHIRKGDYSALFRDLDAFLKLEPKGPMSEQVRQTREKLQRVLAKAQRAPAEAASKTISAGKQGKKVAWEIRKNRKSRARCVGNGVPAVLRMVAFRRTSETMAKLGY